MNFADLSHNILINSSHFIVEVIKIFPPILLLMGLLDAWVPKEKIQNHLGQKSGIRGILLSLLLGTFAAGPLFAAFPIAKSLSLKGVRQANTVIFLGSWATIKIPMFIMESSFLGVRFAFFRLVITLPFIILIGLAIEYLCPDALTLKENENKF